MKRLAIALVLCAATWAQIAAAFCNQPQPRIVCAEYFASQAVLEAELVRVEPVIEHNNPNDIDGYFYTLQATRQLRGTVEPTFRVYEGNDSGRASFDWKIGTTYLLFLFPSREKTGAKIWSLDGCGNSGPVSKSALILDKVARINPNAKTGTVFGMVSDPSLALGLSHVRLAVRGSAGNFEVTTDRKGQFQVNGPPGDYSTEPVRPLSPLLPYEFSYEDPRHLHIQPGSCAQVQLTQQPDLRQ